MASSPPTDDDLVAAANRGNPAAFAQLYERYRDWVVAVARRFTGNEALALDVMQDTFLYFLGKFPGFELRAQIKTFLYPVIRHNAAALLRKRRHSIGTGAEEPDPATATDPANETLDALARAMFALPGPQREVVILRFADQLSVPEIAMAIGVPQGTVKSRIHNALQAIKGDRRLADLIGE
ncbi:MAG: RNA polymerase sigma factor [Planctomycetes bacterium]|nr:RNA polymerase sigma factor [Planctomycetota bacterium]